MKCLAADGHGAEPARSQSAAPWVRHVAGMCLVAAGPVTIPMASACGEHRGIVSCSDCCFPRSPPIHGLGSCCMTSAPSGSVADSPRFPTRSPSRLPSSPTAAMPCWPCCTPSRRLPVPSPRCWPVRSPCGELALSTCRSTRPHDHCNRLRRGGWCRCLGPPEAGRRWNRHEGLAYGTLIVNVVGSLALGLLHDAGPPAITVIGLGGLGAFTTFSSALARDAVALAEARQVALCASYVTVSCLAGIGAAALGMAVI